MVEVPKIQEEYAMKPCYLLFCLSVTAYAQDAATLAARIPAPTNVERALRQPAPPKPVVDAKFITLAGAAIGSALADAALSQSCLSAHTCREANPLMPHNAAAAYALSLGQAAGLTALSWYWRKHHNHAWWVASTLLTASHAIGIWSTARFRR